MEVVKLATRTRPGDDDAFDRQGSMGSSRDMNAIHQTHKNSLFKKFRRTTLVIYTSNPNALKVAIGDVCVKHISFDSMDHGGPSAPTMVMSCRRTKHAPRS
jgi:hypothetical protein